MATLSAHTDDKTASRVGEMAKAEDRSPSQITAAAVRWYVRLSERARDVLRRAEAEGDLAVDEAAWVVGRALLNLDFDKAVQSWADRTRSQSTLPPDASEEEILAEAVRLTRRP